MLDLRRQSVDRARQALDDLGVRSIAPFLTKQVVEAASAEGLDTAPLLALIEAEPSVVPAEMHYTIWARIMRKLRDPSFPIRYTKRRSIDDYEAIGLVCKTAATLSEATDRLIRYQTLLTNLFEVRARGLPDAYILDFDRPGERTLGLRCAAEATLAEVLNAMHAIVSAPLPLSRICFAHAAPPKVEAHQDFFRTELVWGAKQDSLEFQPEATALPVTLFDPGLSKFLLQHLEHLRANAQPDLEQEVQRAIIDALPGGPPKVEHIAQRLNTSARTLQRRLQASQTSFASLVDEARRTMALELLKGDRPLKEIAFLLGFSEPSAFNRAFKRWTGHSPSMHRNTSKRV